MYLTQPKLTNLGQAQSLMELCLGIELGFLLADYTLALITMVAWA